MFCVCLCLDKATCLIKVFEMAESEKEMAEVVRPTMESRMFDTLERDFQEVSK